MTRGETLTLLSLLVAVVTGALWFERTRHHERESPVVVPVPSPTPVKRRPRLLVFTSAGCAPCSRLKAELHGMPYEEVKDAAALRHWRVTATPTLVAVDGAGAELGRREGYASRKDVEAWLDGLKAQDDMPDGPEDVGASVGGPIGPDGAEIAADLPGDLHRKNISSRGEGCCVFRSCHHVGVYADIPQLIDFPEWLQKKGLSGGGYPGNVKERITARCKEMGMPEPEYIQVEGLDLDIIKLACKTGRMVCVTFSNSPSMLNRYGGQRISHMVNVVRADDKFFTILDNNYVGDQAYAYLTPEEFKKTYAPGWCIIFLKVPPPMPPSNN